MWFVYIIRTRRTIYIGCTKDIRERLHHHNNGYIQATKNILPVCLMFVAMFPTRKLAYKFEKYLKSGSGRAFLHKRLISMEGWQSG